MENAFFKSAGFGGFNRKDVIEFIEARAREHADALERCKLETKQARESAIALSEKLAEIEREQAALREERNALAIKLEEQSARAGEEATRAEQLALELREEKAARESLLESKQIDIQADWEAEKAAHAEQIKAEYTALIENLKAENNALMGQLETEREVARKALEAEKAAFSENLEAERSILANQLKSEELSPPEDMKSIKEALAVCRTEKETLEQRLAASEPIVSSYEVIKNRLADIELSAYYRAERIEETAAENAAEIRRKAEQMLINLRNEYNMILTNMNASCSYVIDRLSNVQESLTDLDSAFEKTGESLTDLCTRVAKEEPHAQNLLESNAGDAEEDLPQGNEVPFPEDQL